MLTISRLAAYAGVTVRTVRHYHQIGLLPEPERAHSGYRTYDAAAVVRLIRIRTLADAGVPLARVQELLGAGPEEFAQGIREVDGAIVMDPLAIGIKTAELMVDLERAGIKRYSSGRWAAPSEEVRNVLTKEFGL